MLTSSMFSSQNIDCGSFGKDVKKEEGLINKMLINFWLFCMMVPCKPYVGVITSLSSATRLYHGSPLCGPVIVVY